MTGYGIDLLVSEFGPPVVEYNSRIERHQWHFKYRDEPAADSLGELFYKASQLFPKEFLKRPKTETAVPSDFM